MRVINNQDSHLRWHGSQRRIGITGGIASGKTSIGNFLQQEKGLPTIDADLYSHEALAPGESTTITVINRYGPQIISKSVDDKKHVDRQALSEIIFNNPTERLWLENLIHPIIINKLKNAILANHDAPVIAIIIPLLFEAGLTALCSEIWVVSCTREQQLERLIQRDNLSTFEAQQRIHAQWSLEKKVTLADVVINNYQGSEVWQNQINTLI